jgi:hypothetical protein
MKTEATAIIGIACLRERLSYLNEDALACDLAQEDIEADDDADDRDEDGSDPTHDQQPGFDSLHCRISYRVGYVSGDHIRTGSYGTGEAGASTAEMTNREPTSARGATVESI